MKKVIMINSPKYYGIDTDIKEAFETLGFRTILINQFQLTILERIVKKIARKIRFLKPILNLIIKAYLNKENNDFFAIVSKEKPDLLFVIKGDNILPATMERIKKILPSPIVGYAWDEPFYAHDNVQDDYRRSNLKGCIHHYDLFFVFDPFYIDEIKKQGAKKVHHLPLATNPDRYKDILVTEENKYNAGYDICFIGLPFENRVEMFESLRDYNLGVFGDDWIKYFILKGKKIPSYYKGKAFGATVNKIYLSSKIVLNIHHPQSIESLNTRTFDIPACGAFEMVDYKKNIEKHFEIDKEIVTFNSRSELRSKIDFYLKNDDLRRDISERGKKRVLKEHTWVNRARDIVTILNENGCNL
jgi:spore maturation protein CgeB